MEKDGMIQEAPLVSAPGENLEGFNQAFHQLYRMRQPGWTIEYDRDSDTMYFRAPNHGPAITYFHPGCPEIEFRLDAGSGELVGVDLTNFRSSLVAKDTAWRDLLWAYQTWKAVAAVPGLRRLMRAVSRGMQSIASDELEESSRLCLAP
jgi:hypothetical protein